ncbi:unnamed protein product [Brassicogethes aeneus]|uniref:HTH CENPB-type domain-containing protein n=1 Tax=Brassicogethes aeneus TaxID=1431903 RepID=A0A9P0BBF9_BRAAE|nr:unnamed protein product [Brassicogethes aeneus]
MGPQPYILPEQERILVKWIIDVAKAGFPVQPHQLMTSVQVLMMQLKQQNPFKDNKPGRTWLASFLKRNPEISNRVAQNLTSSRAAVKKESIEKWFTEVYSYLQQSNSEDILQDPCRVFNADETAFFLNPKGSKVLARKGDKTIYQQVNPDEKECLTVLVTGNAAGQVVSPMVIFKYERVPRELAFSVPNEWGIGRSESGWMTGQTFYEFITNIFEKWLTRMKIPRPVILFIDGHSSHLTLHTSRFCAENGIILVALYPNATHLIQPMDVAVFRSLKGGWKDAVHQWRIDHCQSPVLRKIHFCPLLEKVLADKLTPSILKNGFRKCGLVPWNVGAITFPNQKIDIVKKERKLQELKDGIHFMEKYIDKEKLISFKSSENWNGDNQDLSLFTFYKNICLGYNNLEKEIKNIQSKKSAEEQDATNLISEDEEVNNNSINQPALPALDNLIQDLNTEINAQPIPISEADTFNKILVQVDVHKSAIYEPHVTPTKDNKNTDQSPKSPQESDVDSAKTNLPGPSITSVRTTHPPDFDLINIHSSPEEIVPSPFKRVLFWPEPKPATLKKTKSREDTSSCYIKRMARLP